MNIINLTEDIRRDLKLTHEGYNIELLAVQRVTKGYIAIYNVAPKPSSGSGLSEYERLAFYDLDLNRRNSIILC